MTQLQHISRLKSRIENRLEQLFLQPELSGAPLADSIKHSLLAGGARVRPVCFLSVVEVVRPDMVKSDAIVDLAYSLELLHTGSLIHDDLPCMDNAAMRRKKPTNHIVFGEGIATLAGDSLLSLSYSTVISACLKLGINPEITVKLIKLIADTLNSMVSGQAMEFQCRGKQPPKEKIDYIIENKTARIFATAVEMGGLIAGLDKEKCSLLVDYGLNMGIAFQVTDDLLDITSSAEATGKDFNQDISNHICTLPSLLGFSSALNYVEQKTDDAKNALKKLPFKFLVLEEIINIAITQRIDKIKQEKTRDDLH